MSRQRCNSSWEQLIVKFSSSDVCWAAALCNVKCLSSFKSQSWGHSRQPGLCWRGSSGNFSLFTRPSEKKVCSLVRLRTTSSIRVSGNWRETCILVSSCQYPDSRDTCRNFWHHTALVAGKRIRFFRNHFCNVICSKDVTICFLIEPSASAIVECGRCMKSTEIWFEYLILRATIPSSIEHLLSQKKVRNSPFSECRLNSS